MFHLYCVCVILLYRKKQSGGNLQPLVHDGLASSVRSYLTTGLEVGTEYQFQLMATVNNTIRPASDIVERSTDTIGTIL